MRITANSTHPWGAVIFKNITPQAGDVWSKENVAYVKAGRHCGCPMHGRIIKLLGFNGVL
jgi:hypothetical protein